MCVSRSLLSPGFLLTYLISQALVFLSLKPAWNSWLQASALTGIWGMFSSLKSVSLSVSLLLPLSLYLSNEQNENHERSTCGRGSAFPKEVFGKLKIISQLCCLTCPCSDRYRTSVQRTEVTRFLSHVEGGFPHGHINEQSRICKVRKPPTEVVKRWIFERERWACLFL